MQGDAPKKPQRKIPRVEQAAILLMSLGEADAAEVLKHMGPKEVQRVGVAMAQMKDVSKDDVTYVLNQFVDAVGGQTGLGLVMTIISGRCSPRRWVMTRPRA